MAQFIPSTAASYGLRDSFDPDEAIDAQAHLMSDLIRRLGSPPIGSGPATVESVRLDPELRQALAQRAQRDHEATSTVIRKALRLYLEAG